MKAILSQLSPEAFILVGSIGILARDHGMKAYLVGGPVRDLMLKRPVADLDITVEGNGIRLAGAFADLYPGSQVTRYPAFKTATVHLAGGGLVDFATARRETYARGGAFPAVKPSAIKEDLFRRDFTINAMAVSIDPKSWGKLVDPFKGKADLQAGKIRVLHGKSFLDDPTRILRAARFLARFGFKMEAKSLKLLKSAVKIKVLDTIRPQRYLKDFNKILKEPKSLKAIEFLKSWDAYQQQGF